MKSLFSLCRLALLACIFTACNHGSSTGSNTASSPPPAQERPKTPEELRQELKQQEQSNPRTYISTINEKMDPNVVMTKKAGIFSSAEYETQGYILNGYIKNTASVARFKDVTLRVNYISETKSIISSEQFTIYQFVEPNGQIPFDVKTNPPTDYRTYSIDIINATAVN